jgi:hypothetical protein
MAVGVQRIVSYIVPLNWRQVLINMICSIIFSSAPSGAAGCPFYIVIHLQLLVLISIQAKLWAGPVNSLCQLPMILLANAFLATRSVGLLIDCPILARCWFEFQCLQPDGESRPGCHGPRTFHLRLCFWFSYYSGCLGGIAVRVFSYHIPVSISK